MPAANLPAQQPAMVPDTIAGPRVLAMAPCLIRDSTHSLHSLSPTPSRTYGPSSPKFNTDSKSTLVAFGHKRLVQPSTCRLFWIHLGAALTLFLATTDATIVSTALPTIAATFQASQTEYTWVSVSYMLTQTAFQPLYGRVSDLIGRRVVLFSSILIFAAGSALCGAAQSIQWLIIARALAGIGGGGIVSLVWTITSEVVEVRSQAKWSQALSITWACSAVAGPLLGGLFSGDTGGPGWRWAFYMNLPVCTVASLVLWLSLRHVDLGSNHAQSWNVLWRTFDIIGLLAFMSGSGCLIVGFNLASGIGWSAVSTILLIVMGCVVLICGGWYEVNTKREALFPPIAFKDTSIVILLVIIFLHNFAFNAGTYYLALFFQTVYGDSPIRAGVTMLPYSLGSSLASMPTAWFIGYWQRRRLDTSGQKLVICAGLLVATIGFGLMTLMTAESSAIQQGAYPLVAGLGLGMLFHAPYQVFTRALLREDMASGTSGFFLVRFTGATVGLSVAGAICQSRLAQTLPPGFEPSMILGNPSESFAQIPGVVHALSLSIRTIWAVCCPCLGVAFLISMWTRNFVIQGKDVEHQEKSRDTTRAESLVSALPGGEGKA